MTATGGAVASPVPALRLSRRHAAGSASARGLLFTVLGEFVLPTGRAAWTSAFIEVLGRLGVEEKATRQALMRTAADGWLAPDRVGRRTSWSLTPAAERLLVDGSERIYGTGRRPDWDGTWLLVLARAPETERAARHLLRTRLAWAGLGSPTPGVWISTHAERVAEVEAALREAGLLADSQIFSARHHRSGDLAAMARQAWDLEALQRDYAQFLARFVGTGDTSDGADTGATADTDALTSLIGLVHAWRRFPWIDPALPAELLPAGWNGGTAAELFAARHARLVDPARTAWRDLDDASR